MNLGHFRRWQRRALFVGLGVLLLWLLGWAAVPGLARWQIEKQGTQLLGRVVKLEGVAFRPWSMALVVRGLRIGQAGDTDALLEPQLKVSEIEINAALQSLVFWAPVADAIVLREPQLLLTHRGQGRFDIDDVMDRLRGSDSAGSGSSGSGFPRLSLFNIQIVGGGARFLDEPKSVSHTLADVRLDIPFLSNIGGKRDVTTHPRLAFTLNGAAFDTDAETAPFAKDRHTQAHFQIKGLDVAPYLSYWPKAWPVRVVDGLLDLDIGLAFRQETAPEVSLSGHLALTRLKLHEKQGSSAEMPLVQLGGLAVKIDAWRPLEEVLKLDALSFDKPVLHVRRDAAGEINWARLQQFFAPPDSAARLAVKRVPLYELKHFQVAGGELRWQDAATRMPVGLVLSDIDLQSSDLSWPALKVSPLQGKASVQGAKLSWDGSTNLKSAQVRLKWQDFPLQSAAPYWAESFRPALSGQSSADLSLNWRAAGEGAPASLVLKAPQIRVVGASLGPADKAAAALAELVVEQVEVDVFKRQARVGRVVLTRPDLNLSRDRQGRWMFEDWRVLAQASDAEEKTVADPWQLELGQVQVKGGVFKLEDLAMAGGVQLDVRDVNLSMGPWQPLAAWPKMTPVKLDLVTGSQRREAGKLGFEGVFRLPSVGADQAKATPLQLKGRLQLARFPAHKLSPYGAEWLNFDWKRADLGYAGGLELSLPVAGLGLNLQGDVSVENFRAFNKSDGEALLDIKALNLTGLDLGMRAGALNHLKISETGLSDFFARVDISPSGHLNLQNLVKLAPANAAKPEAAKPRIELGPTGVVNGRVSFSDHYIRPNYSAEVTELAGSLGALSNQPADARVAALAPLSLRGRVAGSASLEVDGRINPLTRPVALDVRGKVRDLELPQLSPYSNKYAGYGIERGKLSADVNYRIDADAQLQASHKIILNQLRFGARSDSADAPNLPVKLAVALLADRHGVIDINLPISGSITDPDFRVGAIIMKMVVSLIGKAIIAPFSLIAGAFSGAEQLQQMAFAPGSADVDAATRQKLEAVAKLVIDKPALRLTVVGQADPDSEREALRRSLLRDSVKAEKRRRLIRDGQDARAAMDVSPEEYPALLASVYRRSPIPKPRNVLGGVKDLPQGDMEALLLAAIQVDDSAMRALAQARAQQVRDIFLALGVPAEQLFEGASVVGHGAQKSPLLPQVTLMVSTD